MPVETLPDAVSMADLAAARALFLSGAPAPPEVRPVVLASWLRSSEYGVDPDAMRPQHPDTAALAAARRRSLPLLLAAEPFLQIMSETLAEQPHLVALADADGRILRIASQAGLPAEALGAANLFEGASWHERDIGCNGVGTCLTTGSAVVLIGPEHYQASYVGWTCIGVPLRGPGGEIVGALDLSVPNEHAQAHAWGWTLSVARGIETNLARAVPYGRAEAELSVAELEEPFLAVRGALDLLGSQQDFSATHSRFLDDARATIDQAEARLALTLGRLRETERRLRAVLENSLDAAYRRDIRRDGYSYLSPTVEHVVGIDRTTFAALSDDEVMARVDPRDRERVRTALRDAAASGKGAVEYRFRADDGNERWLAETFTVQGDADGPAFLTGVIRNVTEQKQAEEALRASEARFRAIADLVPDLLWENDAAGIPVWYNRRSLDYSGLTLEQVVGSGWAHLIHPEDRDAAVAAFSAALDSGSPLRSEHRIRGADGLFRWFLVEMQPVRDDADGILHWLGAATDIDDVRSALAAVQESEERLLRIADSGMVGLIFWKLDGAITYTNDRFLEIVGYSRDDWQQGLVDWKSLTPPDWEWADRAGTEEVLATGRTTPYEKEYIRKDGTRVAVLLTAATFLGSREQGLTLIHDISDRVEARRRIEEALENARRAISERESVLSIVSHDLRNPLSTINMSASLLLENISEEKKQAQAAIIRRCVDQMARLIQDLLDAASVEAGMLRIAETDCDADELVRSAVEVLTPLAESRSIAVNVHAGTRRRVRADRNRILQVFSNLLTNAFGHTPEGGSVEVRAEDDVEGTVRFVVRDSGTGIDAADLPRIFDRFWQARRASRAGAGLGLAIARGIVEAHHGRIWAESAPGAGATFSFTLPATDGAAD
jgi:PAS domain S-box-containing protein